MDQIQIKKEDKVAKIELNERALSYCLDSFRMVGMAHGMQGMFAKVLKKQGHEAPEGKDVASVIELHKEVVKQFEEALIKLKAI